MERADSRFIVARDAHRVFTRVVDSASAFLPHDEAWLAWFSGDGSRVSSLMSTREPLQLNEEQERWLLDQPAVPRFGHGSDHNGEGRAWVRAPLRLPDGVAGVLVFFDGPAADYCADDPPRVQWVADVMATLVGEGGLADHFAKLERDRGDRALDASEEMLHELADVLDVRQVFPRISAIVNRVLPHDHLTMTFHESDGHVGLEATSDTSSAEFSRIKVDPDVLARPYLLLPELTPEGLADYQPREARELLLGSGYGSFLAVNVRARGQRMGVEFWSKHVNGFTLADVPVARRIANFVALAVSHEQLADAARQVTTAQTRAWRLEARVRTLSAGLDSRNSAERIVGQSPSWKAVLRAATQVADTTATVLLTGESGTGKELIARYIHAASARRHAPFVAVNCAALPEQLLESEVFGYERGAFTGATHYKAGQIEIAAGGVLFLDEVSEMSPSAQAKFLRVLQEGEYRRLGGTRLLKTDIRVIAATNSDLHRAIENGRFRRDFYYRLRVFDLRLPSLRERRADIAILSDALLHDIAGKLGRPPSELTSAARAALRDHNWPGNVRELRNVLERAAIVCEGGLIDCADLSFDTDPVSSSSTTNLEIVEREMIERVLRECQGNKSRAAKQLGLTRMQLYTRLRRYEGDPDAAN